MNFEFDCFKVSTHKLWNWFWGQEFSVTKILFTVVSFLFHFHFPFILSSILFCMYFWLITFHCFNSFFGPFFSFFLIQFSFSVLSFLFLFYPFILSSSLFCMYFVWSPIHRFQFFLPFFRSPFHSSSHPVSLLCPFFLSFPFILRPTCLTNLTVSPFQTIAKLFPSFPHLFSRNSFYKPTIRPTGL